jgi:hypothetical protein
MRRMEHLKYNFYDKNISVLGNIDHKEENK